MIQSERDNGLDLNAHGEMGNTNTALSTVDGRFFFVTDDLQTTDWVVLEIKDGERNTITATEVQEAVFGEGNDWWFLTINHGSYVTLARAYQIALRVIDEGTETA